MNENALSSVLATGQMQSRVQRRGRYVAESMRHPGKMLPSIAAQVISAFTEPGELVVDPMCGQVITTAEEAGLVLTHRLVALLCGLRDGGLVNRASFFQMLEAWRSQERGLAVCAAAHEDLLILRKRGGEA